MLNKILCNRMFCVSVLKYAVFISFATSLGTCRNISCFINPEYQSQKQDPNPNVVHIISEGEVDVLHYIWSTYKNPSVLVARTTKETEVFINTTKIVSFEKNAIVFENSGPLEAIGITFEELWKFRYPNDSVEVTNHVAEESYDFSTFNWSSVHDTFVCSDGFASTSLKATSEDSLFSKDGTFELQFSVSAKQEQSSDFPHLIFTGNSSMVKVVLNHLHSNSSKVRFGIGMSAYASLYDDCSSDTWKKSQTQSINDEFSPGVFSDVQLLAPCSDEHSSNSSFVAWRPVAYSGVVPIVANSSDVVLSEVAPVQIEDIRSIAELYFIGKTNGSTFNLTFGTQGDGFYTKTEYSTWSFMVGTGHMVEIPLSVSVIIFSVFGLGLLLFFLVSGGGFVLYQFIFGKKKDDLLLN